MGKKMPRMSGIGMRQGAVLMSGSSSKVGYDRCRGAVRRELKALLPLARLLLTIRWNTAGTEKKGGWCETLR